jgi:hypothetical protein
MGKKIASGMAIIVIILIAVAVYFTNPFAKEISGGLQVITGSVSASLFLDDQYLDKAPYINRQIKAGKYTLVINPDDKNLAAKELAVNLNPGVLTVIYWTPGIDQITSSGLIYELEPIADKSRGELQILSEPDGAIIQFSNNEQQFAPYTFREIEEGHHLLTISLPGYESQEQTININAGYRLKISSSLASTSSENIKQETTKIEGEPEETQAGEKQLTIRSTNFFQEGKEVLRVRATGSATANPIGFVESSKTYTYLTEENGWYQLTFEDVLDQTEKEGWVSAQYVNIEENTDESSQ